MRDTDRNERRVRRRPSDNKALVGIIIIVIGSALLLDRLDYFFFPSWIFSWPVIVIAIGLIIGARKGFSGIDWLIVMMVGIFFFLHHHTPFHWQIREYLVPMFIIVIGVFLLFRGVASPSKHRHGDRDRESNPYRAGGDTVTSDPGEPQKKRPAGSGDDFVDVTTIFGSTKKRIFSKDFKGGDTFNMFGSTELDLTQADINGQAYLDITQIFGGAKLIVPANWEIKSDLVAILGGINDKRANVTPAGGSDKVLVIDGTCIFGGIEIKSY